MRPRFAMPSEDVEQINLMKWASYHPICKELLIHIPNGGSRHNLEAYKLKRMGVRAGVSDLFLAYPSKGKSGLWIELKRQKGGTATEMQNEWLEKMTSVGYEAVVAHGWNEAKEKIESYLG